MAEVNITVSGVLCDKYGRTITPCTLVGQASLTGLSVGGGPIEPPEGITEPPIDLPPAGAEQKVTLVAKEPSPGNWGYFPEYGWLYKPAGAEPKR